MTKLTLGFAGALLLLANDAHSQIESNRFRGGSGANADVKKAKGSERELSAEPQVWSKEFVEQMKLATILGQLVKEDGITESTSIAKYDAAYQKFRAFDDGRNDVSLVVKEGNTW